jgi:hypothetical protein
MRATTTPFFFFTYFVGRRKVDLRDSCDWRAREKRAMGGRDEGVCVCLCVEGRERRRQRESEREREGEGEIVVSLRWVVVREKISAPQGCF